MDVVKNDNCDAVEFGTTGASAFVTSSIIGISIDGSLDVYQGSDDIFSVGDDRRGLSSVEAVELADHMIEVWSEFKRQRQQY